MSNHDLHLTVETYRAAQRTARRWMFIGLAAVAVSTGLLSLMAFAQMPGTEYAIIKQTADALNRGDIILALVVVIGVLVTGAVHHVNRMYKLNERLLSVLSSNTAVLNNVRDMLRDFLKD